MKKVILVSLFVAQLIVFSVGFAYGQEKVEPEILPSSEPEQSNVDTSEKINPKDEKTKSKKEIDALEAQSLQATPEPPPLPGMETKAQAVPA